MSIDACAHWENFIRQHIPLAVAMDVHFKNYTGEQLIISAPLSANINHHGTGFGGSLYALAAIASWGLLTIKLAELGISADVVIQQAQVNYQKPVTQDIEIICALKEVSTWQHFIHTYQLHHKARIKLLATATQRQQSCMHFEADFVALSRDS